MHDDIWMIKKCDYAIPKTSVAQDLEEGRMAFQALREVFAEWGKVGLKVSATLGGVSSSGEWSINYENGLWAVFIGERGSRYEPSFFYSAWDAVNFLGFILASKFGFSGGFQKLSPKII